MSLLTANNLSKSFGADEIFDDVSVSIPQSAKIALVGPNGAGKTTLINVLVGLESPSEGTIQIARGTRVGYLPQRPELKGERTVHDEMLSAFEELRQKEAELTALAGQLVDADEELLERYGRQQRAFEEAGGYTYETRIDQVLQGLGFSKDNYKQPLNQLSGGQMTRALLARLLLEKPDLLVLDEPTNHLDISAIEWLEGFLNAFQGAILMVSHDRYFMDKVVNVIWELDWGGLEEYRGNYSHYLQQREERYERRLKEYEAQQAFIAKEEDYIQRNIAGQNTSQAKGRLRRLERLMRGTDRRGRESENAWLKKRPPKRRTFKINLQANTRTGDKVLMTENLSVGYDHVLFTVPDFTLYRGEVAAMIGPNGAGKTTFLKTILGKLNPLGGEVTWGAQVKIGYFAQAHEDLRPEHTLLDEILTMKEMPISEARNYLAAYLFPGDDVFRKVSTLSGGERGRLALAKLALSEANVLLLDEPTNHLDIPSQEMLQDVLANFAGTILMVSHDRYLIDALASQIWCAGAGAVTIFEGTYAEYIAKRTQEQAEKKAEVRKTGQPRSENQRVRGLTPYQREKRVQELEMLIHGLQDEVATLFQAIESASTAGNVGEVSRLSLEYNDKEARLNAILEEWAELAE
jgi:ATP-binding cassette subfamily F protein 3